jgi:hypothetical protein
LRSSADKYFDSVVLGGGVDTKPRPDRVTKAAPRLRVGAAFVSADFIALAADFPGKPTSY